MDPVWLENQQEKPSKPRIIFNTVIHFNLLVNSVAEPEPVGAEVFKLEPEPI